MSRAGNAYADLAHGFVRAFKLGDHISIQEFDEWGMSIGEVLAIDPTNYEVVDRASPEWVRLVADRNNLRKRLNAGAVSNQFLDDGGTPFEVVIEKYGETYEVKPCFDALGVRAHKLPADLDRLVKVKKTKIERLKASVDVTSMTPYQQDLFLGLDRELVKLLRAIRRGIDDFEEEWSMAWDKLPRIGDTEPPRLLNDSGDQDAEN